MEKELIDNKLEMRKLSEDITNNKITSAEGTKKLNELRAKKKEIEQRIALKNAPISKATTNGMFSEIRKAMIEKRAITLNGTGAINQINELVKEIQKKTPLLGGVRYFYGAAANVNIPIFSPTLASPAPYAEGTTSITSDTTAALGNKTLTPYGFVSLLQVSMEALTLGSVNFEAELPSVFADSFSQSFHKQICIGTGTNREFKGIFPVVAANGNAITSTPTIKALRDLALQLADYNDYGVIILHPSVYSIIMADPTEKEADLYKEEIIRSKSIEGIKLILTSSAPASTSAGSIFAVGGRLENYGFALASEIKITPKTTVGDTNTYFEAVLFANGNTIIDSEWTGLKMAAA
jgi:hypothetical protein